MKFGTVVLQPILNRNMKKKLNFILMTSLTSCLKIIDKTAYWRRLKKGHHEILIFFDFFLYNSIIYYKKNLHTKFHTIWSTPPPPRVSRVKILGYFPKDGFTLSWKMKNFPPNHNTSLNISLVNEEIAARAIHRTPKMIVMHFKRAIFFL